MVSSSSQRLWILFIFLFFFFWFCCNLFSLNILENSLITVFLFFITFCLPLRHSINPKYTQNAFRWLKLTACCCCLWYIMSQLNVIQFGPDFYYYFVVFLSYKTIKFFTIAFDLLALVLLSCHSIPIQSIQSIDNAAFINFKDNLFFDFIAYLWMGNPLIIAIETKSPIDKKERILFFSYFVCFVSLLFLTRQNHI